MTRRSSGSGSPEGRTGLLDALPEFARFLATEDRELLSAVTLPTLDVSERPLAVSELLEKRNAFGAVVIDGMLLHYLQIGAQPGLRILGSGDLVALRDAPRSSLFGVSSCRAIASTRIALLGRELLLAMRHVPRLAIGLHTEMAEQMQRLATQLVICQLPRVEDRVLAMLWLLAESWGRVTPSGTTLPLALTHEVIGALVGARRPTVTLALGELANRGALVQQDRGWLLLELPEPVAGRPPTYEEPRLLDDEPSSWALQLSPEWDAARALAALTETVESLREVHARNVGQVRDRLRRAALSRERAAQVRQRSQSSRRRFSRPLPPSSG